MTVGHVIHWWRVITEDRLSHYHTSLCHYQTTDKVLQQKSTLWTHRLVRSPYSKNNHPEHFFNWIRNRANRKDLWESVPFDGALLEGVEDLPVVAELTEEALLPTQAAAENVGAGKLDYLGQVGSQFPINHLQGAGRMQMSDGSAHLCHSCRVKSRRCERNPYTDVLWPALLNPVVFNIFPDYSHLSLSHSTRLFAR